MERRRSEHKIFTQYGVIGFVLSLFLSFAMHHSVTRNGHQAVVEKALSEAGLLVELTGSFVRTYSSYQARLSRGTLPNPATFRAEALRHVEQAARTDGLVSTGVVGLPGREIAKVASDDVMRGQLIALEATPSTDVLSSVIPANGQTTHRSLWAFFASEQACADCHNRLQNLAGGDRWQVGDLMGAQVVEQNIEPQLDQVRHNAWVQAILLFVAVLAIWFCLLYLVNHFRLTRKLRMLATTDPLTGCINRREFQDRISKLKGPTKGALLMLDLDKFKQINDTFGHDAGDEVICNFVRCLRRALRTDDWVVRFGGEEFIVWLPDIGPLDAIKVAERVRTDAEQATVAIDESSIRYTVSIGLHIVENAQPSRFESWIKVADQLVYRAKAEGRNRVICEMSTNCSS